VAGETAILLILLAALAAPPQARDPGERAFQRCGGCHSLGADDSQSVAPGLRGVVGRRAGAAEGFAYSDAMRAAGRRGLVWDEATLARFLEDPEAVVPGTAMPYQGGPAAERAAVIDYLRRHPD
jgi:cytochrome c